MGMPELEIYSMIGAEGFGRLVAAFYRQVPQDDLLGPIYPASDLPGAEQRLRDFLIGRFGGPQTYIEQRGQAHRRGSYLRTRQLAAKKSCIESEMCVPRVKQE